MSNILEDSDSTGGCVHEGQERKCTGEKHRSERQTVLCAVSQELGRLSTESETVKDSRRSEEERIARREGGCEDAGIDDVREDLDARTCDGNDVGRLCSGS